MTEVESKQIMTQVARTFTAEDWERYAARWSKWRLRDKLCLLKECSWLLSIKIKNGDYVVVPSTAEGRSICRRNNILFPIEQDHQKMAQDALYVFGLYL